MRDAEVQIENEGVLMRKVLFLLCILGMPCASWAQSNPASWENLHMLQTEDKVQVVEMNSKKVSGAFLNVSDAAVSLQEQGGQQTVQRQDVRSVKLMKHQHRLRNTLIGAAVGAGAGAGIGTVADRKGSWFPNLFAETGAVVGLVGGAVVGAVVPSHKTIYRVQGH
jgi:phage-related tail protein